MREQRPCRFRVRPDGGRLRRKPVDPFLERLDGVRRCVARQIEDRCCQCTGRRCELRVLSGERRTRAQQANVRQRILQERVAALESLRQFLLLGHRRSQTVDRPAIEASPPARGTGAGPPRPPSPPWPWRGCRSCEAGRRAPAGRRDGERPRQARNRQRPEASPHRLVRSCQFRAAAAK